MREIKAADMVAGDIVRLKGDDWRTFQDMLVTKVEVGHRPQHDKVYMMRPWMENKPYPMTGHEAFTVWRDSSMTFLLMRESQERVK